MCQVTLLIYYMDVEMTWAYKHVIFVEYYVRLEGNNPSQLKPSWRPHHQHLVPHIQVQIHPKKSNN